MQKTNEKQAVMRLKLWLFRIKNNNWPKNTVLTERQDFELFFKNPGWESVAIWFNNPESEFPEEAIRELMERVVYARG
jgi:hypothetical protein